MSRFKKILALILLSGFLLAPVLTFANAARFGYSNTGTTTPPSTASASEFNDTGGCDLIMYTGNNVFVSCTAAKISAFLLSLAADLLYRAGTMFDFSIDYSLNMAARLGEFKFVSNGWGVLRDVTNLAYIFILLYISINIILGNSGYGDKSLIAKVLITAVFVNFSLFGAKVIIDATNIGALQFYNLITPASSSDSRTKNSNAKGLTGQFMKLFNLQSIYGNDDETSTDGVLNSVAGSARGEYNQSGTWWRIVKLCVFGIIFIIAVTVVFAAGSILFLSRTITLFFLMLFASLAVASRALPATKGQFDSWLKKLINNSIFAPIFLGLIYIFVSATNNVEKGGNLADIILKGGNISAIVTFLMYLAFLVGLLLVAKQLGIKGGDAAHGFADKWLSPKSIGNRALGGAKMVGRGALGGAKMVGKGALNVGKGALIRTGGRVATSFAESGMMKNLSSKVPSILGGGYLRRGLASVGKATGYDKVSKDDAADLKKEYEYLAKSASKDPERVQWARERANSVLGMDENGDVKGVWNKTKRLIGGKGTRDAQDAIKKKWKKESADKARVEFETKETASIIADRTGIVNVTDEIAGEENMKNLFILLDNENFNLDSSFNLIIGKDAEGNDVVIQSDKTLAKTYADYITTPDGPEKRMAKNEFNQEVKKIKDKIKTYTDAKRRASEKEDRDADKKAGSEKKDDSKPKP